MKQLLKHPYKSVGSYVNVEIDYCKKTVFRSYLTKPTLVNGLNINIPLKKTEALFKNEVYWLTKLRNQDYLPKLLDIDFEKKLIIQEFLGEDLLIKTINKTISWSNLLSSQLIEIYKDFYQKNILKRNGALSNMGIRKNGQIVLFDFKWCCIASSKNKSINCNSLGTTCFDDEVYSIQKFLSKIPKKLSKNIYNMFEYHFSQYKWSRIDSI